MFVDEYIEQLANDKLDGNLSRFDGLCDLVPDCAQKLRAFDSNSAWLHWRKKTYDGWYCVQTPDGKFEVYYQERGSKEPSIVFTDEREAIRFALNATVLTLE
jgi:hypothetical protein